MPKYLIKAYYSADGFAGVAAKGGSARRNAVAKMVSAVGGTLETFYYAWGEVDAYVIVDMPDEATMVGVALAINKSGATKISTTPLFTLEQADKAAGVTPVYTPPGQT